MTEFAASVIVRHRVSLREADDRLQRTIQYAVTSRFMSGALEYWMPRFREA
jgi:hypothetical protein